MVEIFTIFLCALTTFIYLVENIFSSTIFTRICAKKHLGTKKKRLQCNKHHKHFYILYFLLIT